VSVSGVDAPRHDPIPIGDIAEPPLARLPDPTKLFNARAKRFCAVSQGHELAPYLRFLGDLSEAQHRLQDGLAAPDMPAEEVRERARSFAMPPLDRNAFNPDVAFMTTLERLFSLARDIDMPAEARTALAHATAADPAACDSMIRAVLADAIPVEGLASHLFVTAALQVHFARQAAQLDVKSLVRVGDGACPVCGGPPVASMVVGWAGAHNTRFCACSLCSTLWNALRVKCMLCGSITGINYQQVDGGDGQVRAETCENCHGYLKILQEVENPWLDPVADDVASLALDLLVRERGYRRGAVNQFLLGY
jgi:FdhE protein